AVRYFFRREVETNAELARGLAFTRMEALGAAQEAGFAALAEALSTRGQQLEDLLGDVRAVVAQTHERVLDLQGELHRQGQQHRDLYAAVTELLDLHRLQRRQLRPSDSFSL